jgi:hypothetical protein
MNNGIGCNAGDTTPAAAATMDGKSILPVRQENCRKRSKTQLQLAKTSQSAVMAVMVVPATTMLLLLEAGTNTTSNGLQQPVRRDNSRYAETAAVPTVPKTVTTAPTGPAQ